MAFLLPSSSYSGPFSSGLQISATNGTANVSWTGSGYWLQAADLLGDPLSWYNSPWSASSTGPQFSASVPMDSSTRFFRLVSSSFLPPPTGMQAVAGDSNIYVTWDTVSNAISYNLYMATAPGVTPFNYNSLPNGAVLAGFSQPQAVFDNLTPGLRYYFVATAVNAQGESAASNEGSDVFGPQGQVHGSFFTPVFDGTITNQIFVPGVTVTFQTNGVTMAQATTDDTGKFVATPVPAGTYQVCWSAPGFVSGCSTQLVAVSNLVVYLDPQEIDPLTTPGIGLVFGDVKLRDGSVPAFDANNFGTSLSTTVTLKDDMGNVVAATTVNNYGQYLLTGVPVGPNLTLTASAEAASVTSNIDTTVTGEANLILPNTPPVIQSVLATLNGQIVDHASTGATVQLTVTATDAENDFLHYTWLGGPGADNLVSVDSSNLSLTLSGTNGLVTVYVQVGDGKGGYADSQFFLNVESQMTFSGYVEDTSGNVIVNAAVSVNSASTSTDTNGYFSLMLPVSQDQFLLNITAAGYASFSELLDDSASGETYQLAPLETVCTNWTGAPVSFSDSYGTTVALQANSLESAPGVPYVGPICASIVTYDPCSDTPPYPAGNIAIDNLGNTNWITPQVTAYVLISDAGGNPLMIEPGLPATLILPLGQTCTPLTNPPCVLPAWAWDPTNAVWRMTGLATNLAGDCASGPFAGPMLQMGLQAAAAPAPSCQVSISVDRTINLPVVLQVSSQAPLIEINEKSLADLQRNGVKVPVNQPVTFQLLNPKEAPCDYYTNLNDAASKQPDAKKTVILKITKTFTKDDQITLSLSAQIPLLTDDRVENNLHFLTYNDPEKSIGPNITGGPVDEYYRAAGYPIDGTTFFTWLQNNGFINPPNGTFESNYVENASALYFNATDLGFVRSMHMKTKPGVDGNMDIAYYVVNYRTIQDAVARPTQDGKAVATVAMDYVATILTNTAKSPTTYVTNRITRFYVFGFFDDGFNKNMGLRRNANLDGAGAKIDPNLCITCHGSSPLTFKKQGRLGWTINPPDGDAKGHFIPFDLESFTYLPGTGVQQAQFRDLNRGIYLYTPLTPAMKELIEGWYGGALNNANNNNFTSGFVPAGWAANAAQKNLYLNAVRVSCRGCHTMRENISFNTYKSLNDEVNKESVVCKTLDMPNAQRTFTIFWGSMAANIIKNGVTPDQPTLLKNQFNWGACPAPAP